jgi:hypothetical protein
VQAQGTGIRDVSASSRSLIPLQTRLRYTTMVVLPEGEEILDVICGDKDFWVISSTHNIAHVKPAKEGAATNMNLVPDETLLPWCELTARWHLIDPQEIFDASRDRPHVGTTCHRAAVPHKN